MTGSAAASSRDISTRREALLLLGLGLVSLSLFFWRLGTPGLMDPDEGRYAEIAREMLVLKDWLVPRLNFLPYLEKPPLVYWLTATSFGALGLTEFAARLPAALSALAGVGAVYGLGRALTGPAAGLGGAFILATCGGYVVLGRILTLDMTLTLFVNLGIGLGHLAVSRKRRNLLPWAYAALGLGVMTKGPVALVLAGLIWGLWGLWARRSPFSFLHPLGLGLLAAITLPWFIGVTREHPEFLKFFFYEHHVARFAAGTIHHHQPFVYYVPVLLGFMLPWSWLLPWALTRRGASAHPDRLFLLIWAGVVLVFFSVSRGKLAPYILPALWPLALLVGEALARVVGRGWEFEGRAGGREAQPLAPFLKITLYAWAGSWLAAGLYVWAPGKLAGLAAQGKILSPYLTVGLVLLALIPTLALLSRNLHVLWLGALAMALLIPGAMKNLSHVRSPREAGEIVKREWRPEAALVGFNLYSQALSFYSGQPFYLSDFKTELDFGRQVAPDNGFFYTDPKDIAAMIKGRSRVFLFLKEEDFQPLQPFLPEGGRIAAHYKDCLLVLYEGK